MTICGGETSNQKINWQNLINFYINQLLMKIKVRFWIFMKAKVITYCSKISFLIVAWPFFLGLIILTPR